MPNTEDLEERRLTSRLFLIIAGALIALGIVLYFFLAPALISITEPGLNLRDSVVYAFVLTLVSVIVMAFAAGDGLLGEIQYMMAAFAGFFLISWFMIAWIF